MTERRARRGPIATLAVLWCAVAWAHGCGIDLSKNDLAGKPCKNKACLPGYVCSEANICVLATTTGSGGELGSGGSSGNGGTEGSGGSSEGTGGTGGTDMDAAGDVEDAPDANDDHSIDATGGTAGSGGTAGGDATGGTAGDSGTVNRWPGVGCLQLACTQAQICCVSVYPGYPNPPPATAFRCADPGATCAYTLHCDGDHDCPAGQECCVVNTAGGWVASCAASCANPPYHVQCTKPEHCATGAVCCAVNFQINRFESFSCRPSCNGFNDRVVCNGEMDCLSTQDCLPSAVLPGFKTCQP
jgi:hypothetical protein